MKPTEFQTKIANIISGTIKHWGSTNDISSPSHFSLIDDDVNSLEISESDKVWVQKYLEELYYIIRANKTPS